MIDAGHYRISDTLRNGMVVTIRSIRPDDKEKMVEAFRNLEKDSVYTRFFRYKNELTDEDLKVATEVDFETTVALVVTAGSGQDETIIGAGRYIAYHAADGLGNAEVAFMVEEDYHGLGIASRILRHLIGIARDKGIAAFEADVLPQNKAMLTVFARSGLPVKQAFSDGVVHVTLELREGT